MTSSMTGQPTVDRARAALTDLRQEVAKAVVGQDSVVTGLVIALLCRGHVLLEGVPGVAKTLLVRALAAALEVETKRVQFTPDLMPGDITGSLVYDARTAQFSFSAGPVFTNLLLADEINRTPPKTQAALLEAMEERQVTVDGVTRPLAPPFMVVATQNPIEHEGTYPLPEAQLDRFMMRVAVGYPTRDKELEMLDTHGLRSSFPDLNPVVAASELQAMIEVARHVQVTAAIKGYIIDVAEATRRHPEVLLGASPRSALYLQRAARARAASEGREYVIPDDVKNLAPAVLEHRLALRPEAQMRGVAAAEVVSSVLGGLRVPVHRTS
jgi:MoxR-like ATPase